MSSSIIIIIFEIDNLRRVDVDLPRNIAVLGRCRQTSFSAHILVYILDSVMLTLTQVVTAAAREKVEMVDRVSAAYAGSIRDK